jgi:hypothetical protein
VFVRVYKQIVSPNVNLTYLFCLWTCRTDQVPRARFAREAEVDKCQHDMRAIAAPSQRLKCDVYVTPPLPQA